jgi:hypothetical protein
MSAPGIYPHHSEGELGRFLLFECLILPHPFHLSLLDVVALHLALSSAVSGPCDSEGLEPSTSSYREELAAWPMALVEPSQGG